MELLITLLVTSTLFGLYIYYHKRYPILQMPFNYQYRVFKRAYRAYKPVRSGDKLYRIYVEDFLAHYKYISEGKIKSDFNERVVANRVCNIIENHQEMLERYFSSKFGYFEFLNMMSEYNLFQEQEQVNEIIEPIIDITPAVATAPVIVVEPLAVVVAEIKTPIKNSKEKIDNLVREEILKYEKEIIKPKHVGHRIFGFYLRAFHPGVTSESERVRIWRKLTLLDNAPEKSYAANPYIDKNNTEITKTHILTAINFCHSAGLNVGDFIKKFKSTN